MNNILKKIRRYEIQIRKILNNQVQGDYRSIFRGSGLEYDDVRSYQYGDDIRTVNWRVSAKGHGTFVNTYKEEKEQTVFFMVDMSGSEEIGEHNLHKIDVQKEIFGVLGLAAAKEGSRIGLLGFSDKKELYMRPSKGESYAYECISKLYKVQPRSKGTSLKKAILFTLKNIKRRSVIFIISDFIDKDYQKNLKSMARKHDVVAIKVNDKRETNLPKLGVIPVLNKESGKVTYVNTSGGTFQKALHATYQKENDDLKQLCHKHQINLLNLDTTTDYVPSLIKLFRIRNLSYKSV